MPDYRRAWHPGSTYFFTVNLWQRHNNDLLVRHIDVLRQVVRAVQIRHPFNIHGWVVLPDQSSTTARQRVNWASDRRKSS
jgi:putative transposase